MNYHINFRNLIKQIHPLKFHGIAPNGNKISFNNYYMELNGRPFFGIAGEFHYSRYPYQYWEEEILKMQAAGLNVITTYAFWIHHEEEEGVFRWDGDRNLRYFLDLCAKHGFYVILRIGPFCHGECRNGGLPDWLYGRPFEVRSNDPGYLFYVRRWYEEIARQVAGLLFRDGGPVIGIQLENEYMHVAVPWELTAGQGDELLPAGKDGAEHMLTLKKIAVESGLEVPFYTCTGWGGSPVPEGEMLPIHGGYAFWPWSIDESHPLQEPTGEYLFRDFHGEECREEYPYLCGEIGGGMQCWYKARFIVPPESVEAMVLTKIANGCNFIGLYMFHGGSQPLGKSGFLHENTNPKISYDFQAPIGEFGQIRDSYRYLKPIFYFLHEFGKKICPMFTVVPDDVKKITPETTESLRFAARVKENAGVPADLLQNDQVAKIISLKVFPEYEVTIMRSDESGE